MEGTKEPEELDDRGPAQWEVRSVEKRAESVVKEDNQLYSKQNASKMTWVVNWAWVKKTEAKK